MGRVLGRATTFPGTDEREMSGGRRARGGSHLVKGNPQIDVHDLSRPIVHQNVGYMSIPKT